MTIPPVVAPEIIAFYTEGSDEATRLTSSADGKLELIRTQELLRRHLPSAPANILDVGGGTGVHAQWLTAEGYTVHLVDPVPRHIEAAQQAGCTVELGDARQLSAPEQSYDVVLLPGPSIACSTRRTGSEPWRKPDVSSNQGAYSRLRRSAVTPPCSNTRRPLGWVANESTTR